MLDEFRQKETGVGEINCDVRLSYWYYRNVQETNLREVSQEDSTGFGDGLDIYSLVLFLVSLTFN